jgi:heme-degrading monooxygenase HmoA
LEQQQAMIARVRTIRLAPGGLVQAIEMVRDDELPTLKQASGFVGMILLASLSDSATGERAEVISLWDSQHALDTFAASGGLDAQPTQAMPLLTAPIEVRIYEVALAAGMTGGTVARFIAAKLHPGNIDTVVTLFENVVMHAATEQHGFRRGLLLVDRAADYAISIGLWQTEDDLHASEQVGYVSQQIGNFIQIVATPIVPETLVVAIEG